VVSEHFPWQTLWENIFFFFADFFFEEEKKGPRHSGKFMHISMQNLKKQVADLRSSQKNTQVQKKKSSEMESGK
jgi:hypothetical protein